MYHHNSNVGSMLQNTLVNLDINDTSLVDHPITYFSRDHNPWIIYLELLPPDSPETSLPPYNPTMNLLIFFKYYDPVNKSLTYAGSRVVVHDDKLSDLTSELNKFIGSPSDTALDFYKCKSKADALQPISTFVKNGEIIIFEKTEKLPNLELPTYVEYYTDLQYRVEVTFIDKNITNDNGFTIELSCHSNYDQMAKVSWLIKK
jgi:ubiquitin carboxyl-terminal hydrolase 7